MVARNKPISKTLYLKHAVVLAAYLLVVWGFYRYLVKFPDSVEELIVKPVVWLVPVGYFLYQERHGIASLGITFKNLFPALYLALGLGAVFVIEAVVVNYLKYHAFIFNVELTSTMLWESLGLSVITATTEEVAFRGFIFGRVLLALENEWVANVSTSVVWALIHAPIVFFVWKLDIAAAIIYLFLATLFGIGSAFIYARTKNIFSSVLLHVL